jgi:hypothetical protein
MTVQEFLADILMVAHASFSVFVLYGLVFILAGTIVDWRWARNRWFLNLHLAATIFLLARIWLGLPCPFSATEDYLRSQISMSCPLGIMTHAIFHQLAFRGNDPHGFALWTTLFGVLAVSIQVAARYRWKDRVKSASPAPCAKI